MKNTYTSLPLLSCLLSQFTSNKAFFLGYHQPFSQFLPSRLFFWVIQLSVCWVPKLPGRQSKFLSTDLRGGEGKASSSLPPPWLEGNVIALQHLSPDIFFNGLFNLKLDFSHLLFASQNAYCYFA